MKHIINIEPFISAGNFVLNEKRENLLPKIELKLKTTRFETLGKNEFIIDDYEEALAYYNKSNGRLFYVLFAPLPTIELRFNNINLFDKNSLEIYNLLKNKDENLVEEEYVGFGSKKYGIDIYSPNFTEEKTCSVDAISFAIKGYFDSIYDNEELDINSLQKMKR